MVRFGPRTQREREGEGTRWSEENSDYIRMNEISIKTPAQTSLPHTLSRIDTYSLVEWIGESLDQYKRKQKLDGT